MATIDKRKNKAAGAAAAASAGGKAKGAASSRNSAAKNIVEAEEEEEDQEEEYEEDAAPNSDDEVAPPPPPRRRAPILVPAATPRKVNLKASIDFVQVLIFACVMLQALTLFVTYHSSQAAQHAEKVQAGLQASLSHLTAQNTLMADRIARMETVQLDTFSFTKTMLAHNSDRVDEATTNLNTATTTTAAAARK